MPDAFFPDEPRAETLTRKLGMDEKIVAPSRDGRKGGLLLV